jgi:hypothetical protein
MARPRHRGREVRAVDGIPTPLDIPTPLEMSMGNVSMETRTRLDVHELRYL